MKRGHLIGIFIFVLLVVNICLVAAQTSQGALELVQDTFRPFLEAIFGSADYVFEELLFALIIIAFVYMALSNFIEDNPALLWILTLAVAILGVRFIVSEKMVEILLFPQGVLAVGAITIIPLVACFWFIEIGLDGPKKRVLRKICWVTLGVIYIFMWARYFYVPSHTETVFKWIVPVGTRTVPASVASGGYMYLAIPIFSVLFLLFDKTIQASLSKVKTEHATSIQKDNLIKKAYRDLNQVHEDYANGIYSKIGGGGQKKYQEDVNRLNEVIKNLST